MILSYTCQQMEDFEIKRSVNNCYNRDRYLLIVCRSLPPKTLFEASLFWMEVMRLQEGNCFIYCSPAGALPK